MNTNFSRNMYEIMMNYAEVYRIYLDMENPPLHDPNIISYIINPQMFEVF